MSGRGGRGGRGGGRGGARKPAPPGMPGGDDPSLIIIDQPQENYPKTYKPPVAPQLTPAEERSVAYFVKFRQTYHNTPLYTHRHINAAYQSTGGPVLARHGQAQINARYSVKNRAAVDPFLAVPTYSERFVDDTRTLPKLRGARRYVKDLFPEELWGTLEGKDTNGPKGGFQTTKETSTRGTKRKADDDEDDMFVDGDDDDMFVSSRSTRRRENETEEERKARIEGAGQDADKEDGDAGDADDDEEGEMELEDDDYDSADDDAGGDYNAEAYFDNGDDDDFGDDDGVGESAMDF